MSYNVKFKNDHNFFYIKLYTSSQIRNKIDKVNDNNMIKINY